MSLPTYPHYRTSGAAWFGEIPAHWNLVSLKHIVSIPITDGPHETPAFLDEGIPFVSAEAVAGGFVNFDKIRGHIAPELHKFYSKKYKPRRHDIYMVKSGATTGVVAIVETDKDFNIWSPLAAIRCDQERAYPFFVLRALQARNFQESVALHWNFGTQQNIGMGTLGDLPIPLPPIGEQITIAAFLDRETAKIDALVAEQDKLIALLAEKRQATISHVVTRGLNADAPMKDSGVAWLGEVPAHWAVKQLKHVARPGTSITYGIVQAGPHHEGGIPYIRTSDMAGDRLPLDGYALTSPEVDASYARSKVVAGDLVIAIRATVGKCLSVPPELAGANLTQGTAKVSPGDDVASSFLLAFLRSSASHNYFESMAKGATFKEITLDALRRTPVLLPPMKEQLEIAVFVDAETKILDALQDKSKRAIALLKERRSALIAAAVTGQIDVRGSMSLLQPDHVALAA
jgi:type I restriction enzyme, S subunit